MEHAVSEAKNAAEQAENSGTVFCLGEIIHNKGVVEELAQSGLKTIDDLSQAPDGSTVIIRSHGAEKSVYTEAKSRNITLIDTTCKFVQHIQKTAEKYHADGYKIVLTGESTHPEIKSINSFCDYSALIINEDTPLCIEGFDKVCVLSQTTFSSEAFEKIKSKLKLSKKTVEFFNTICYTTIARQKEAQELAAKSDAVVVVGGCNSSNTKKLEAIAKASCDTVFLIENSEELTSLDLKSKFGTVAVLSGASTPKGVIMEVVSTMEKMAEEKNEFLEAVGNLPDKKTPRLKKGQKIKVTVVSVSDEGLMVNKVNNGIAMLQSEAIIPKGHLSTELSAEEALKTYSVGDEVEATIIDTSKSPYVLSLTSKPEMVSRRPKRVSSEPKEQLPPDPVIDTIRNGEEFSHTFTEVNKGGLIGKFSTYSLFVPASQIKSTYVTKLENYTNKPLRLVATDINDEGRKIVASQKKILEKEKQDKDESFWGSIEVGASVKGKVLRFTEFGAFVDVNGFDCLAHNTDLSWGAIKQPSEVLTIGETYDFLVLKASREKGRVSLGLKQLSENPWALAAEKYPVGITVSGRVTDIKPYGAYVAIEQGLDGLVHVSNLSHEWINSINEKIAVGDEIEARVIEVVPESKRLSLSIKALQPMPEREPRTDTRKKSSPKRPGDEKEFEGKKPSRDNKGQRSSSPRPRRRDEDDLPHEYFSESGGSSIADLLKDLKIDDEN